MLLNDSTGLPEKNTDQSCIRVGPRIGFKNRTSQITILDRIKLPQYQYTTTNGQNEEEDSVQLEFRPRGYFVAGLCYLCCAPGNPNFACSNCNGMVEYCSSNHLKQHSKSHSHLCPLLAELSRRCNEDNSSITSLDPDAWRRFRLGTVEAAKNGLGRELELWEREALLYPKLCSKCRYSKGLQACPGCGLEFRCEKHLEEWHEGVVGRCDEMKLFGAMLREQNRRASCTAPEIPSGWRLKIDEKIPDSLEDALRLVFGEKRHACIDATSYAALSVVASPPLTALRALIACHDMKDLQKQEELCVHIIGAELQFECANLGAWEILFVHMLPGLKILHLELYGPELHVPAEIAQVLEQPTLCSSCRSFSREFDVRFHCGKLYHQIENERKPDLVCLFNPGLYRTTAFGNQIASRGRVILPRLLDKLTTLVQTHRFWFDELRTISYLLEQSEEVTYPGDLP
ncbi:hypothetical protein QAD02_023206 [Eretmocerus hayati]|uniref:Uncharacterized protein n=1 Tax=Eretmocerus hayati TaxID=131215 RepID=A0ACC2PVD7_9HYME|nr:hypothetical protein QAD02_023206 [Eretmocerus hayati]